MQVATHAGPRSEPRIPLSRQRVLRAAVKLADGGGIESLTMRRLAEELGAEAMSLYLARGLKLGQARPEADEIIEIALVPLSLAVAMVMRAEIQDAKTIAGILWLECQTRPRNRKRK